MDDFSVRGAEAFGRLAADLRRAGDKDLRRELYAGLNRATKPLKEDAKRGAERLPRRGGLAERVRRARFSTRSRGGRNPSIRVEAKDAKGRSADLPALDRGVLRHPVYGTKRWVTQRVEPGWFSDSVEKSVPLVRDEVLRAIDAVAAKFYRGR